jgi:putative spermidine/putrescine transport system ATP-binding protein
MARVEFEHVTKRFGETLAVADFTLDIADGEFMVLVGPSGSGKTTALRLLAGLESIGSGSIRIGDRTVDDVAPRERDIAMVFQDYALYPQMSVRQNLAFGLRIRKLAKAEVQSRVEEAAELLGIGQLLERKPRELSGGQRQRVALARALVNRPKVLLLDEPLGALDLKLRREMQLELKLIQREVGITFVFVTHDQEEALSMSDRVAVFNEGKVEQVATPVELYEHPASSFVAGFVGTSNRIGGDAARAVLGVAGEYAVRPEKLRLAPPGQAPASDEVAAPGVVREVVYLGPSTHTIVELEAGPRLTVSRPNSGASAHDSLEASGAHVSVVWHRGSQISLSGPHDENQEKP